MQGTSNAVPGGQNVSLFDCDGNVTVNMLLTGDLLQKGAPIGCCRDNEEFN
jgi:hypothetical protein